MSGKKWMIYGAYGYSGRLIAEEAKHRGLNPVVAGRNADKTKALADEFGFDHVAFDLADTPKLTQSLQEMHLVLHCAGPFSQTARPMLEACLKTQTHYLDITGEIDVFEQAHQLHQPATQAGILLCPGVGFDVIPTDCLALTLKQALPDASHLALGFDSRSGFSRGTARTAVEGLATGGRIRKDGALTRVPIAYRQRRIDFGCGEKLATTIPWGDVATAYFSTSIPNIEVYIPTSPGMARKMKRMRLVQPILGWSLVQKFLKGQVDKKIKGPSEKVRAKTTTHVWGEVSDASGKTITGRLHTANGYEVTRTGAVAIAMHLLKGCKVTGYTTPSKLMGANFASTLPGSGEISLETT